jgi:hypothetical protein
MIRAAGVAIAATAVAITFGGGALVTADTAKPTVVPLHFSHASHAARLGKDAHNCPLCHSVDDAGQVKPPASLGHAPCMQAQCHATWFLAVGAAGAKNNVALHDRAAQFCAGCHDPANGSPPKMWTKASPAAVLESFKDEREFHIEMSDKGTHYEHTRNTECRECHVVDEKTLVTSSPGHAQCVKCHNAKALPDHTMAKCMRCHFEGGRQETYGNLKRRPTDVTSCGSEGKAQLDEELAKQRKRSKACFKHETKAHRTTNKGEPVQCGQCHGLVKQPEYTDLKELHTRPIISPSKEIQHPLCGSCHQHENEVKDPTEKQCEKCHAKKTTDTF